MIRLSNENTIGIGDEIAALLSMLTDEESLEGEDLTLKHKIVDLLSYILQYFTDKTKIKEKIAGLFPVVSDEGIAAVLGGQLGMKILDHITSEISKAARGYNPNYPGESKYLENLSRESIY